MARVLSLAAGWIGCLCVAWVECRLKHRRHCPKTRSQLLHTRREFSMVSFSPIVTGEGQASHQDPVGSPHQSQGSVPGTHWGIIQSEYAARMKWSLILVRGSHMLRRANGLLAALVSSQACHAGSMAQGGGGSRPSS